MATIAELNIEKATVLQQLYDNDNRVVVKATDEINESSFLYGQNKRQYKVDTMAQGSEFYVPKIFRDWITLNANRYQLTWNW